MVFRTDLDAQASVDLHILSQHYNGKSGPLQHYTPKKVPLPSGAAVAVVSLADFGADRQRADRKKGITQRIMGLLRRRSKPQVETRGDEETKTKAYVIENYEREMIHTLRSEGINSIVGAAKESLLDDSDDDASLEIELERINSDDESISQTTAPSHVQIQENIAESAESGKVTPPDLSMETLSDDPWTFLLWFFACTDVLSTPSQEKAKKGKQMQVHTKREIMLDGNVDILSGTDEESLETDFSQEFSETDYSSCQDDK